MSQIEQSGHRLDPAGTRAFCKRVLVNLGMSEPDATIAAEVLVRCDMRGIHTHGVRHLHNYVGRIRAGGIVADATFEVTGTRGGTATVDAHAGMGHVTAVKATQLAMQLARETGVGVVAVRNSNHFGAAGHYALIQAEAEHIGLVYTNAPLIMKATGSKRRVLGNGPAAYGIPASECPVVFDAAMSVVAGSTVSMAAERGMPIPDGWVVDAAGRPTTNPRDLLDGGALVPIADHKGYGLALMTELLAGGLSGSAMGSSIGGADRTNYRVGKQTPWNVGHVIMSIDVSAFGPTQAFLERVDTWANEIRNSDLEPSRNRIYLPGEIEYEREQLANARGLEFDEVSWQSMFDLAADTATQELLASAHF